MVIAYSSKSSFERNPQVSQSGNSGKYQAARSSYMDTLQASIERREKRRREEEEAKLKAELQAQEEAALARRDERQHKYGQSDTNQRAGIASAAADQDFLNTSQLNRQQQAGLLKRDDRQNQFMTGRDLQQAIDVQNRDKRQFGYSRMDSEQKFGQQLQRDELQQGYTLDRDASQNGMQAERDQRLNQFDSQRTQGQNQFQLERDAKQQGYSQQDAARRETAEISAKWNDQIQQARSQGLDFSEAQKQKLNELDRVFRENVMGNDELDEGLRQQAMLLHQKKVSQIIPDERIKSPQDIYQQSRIFDEELGIYLLHTQDPKGGPRFEPLAGKNDGFAEQQRMQEKEQQRAEKQMDVTRKAEFDRLQNFRGLVKELRTELDPNTDRPRYADDKAVMKAAMDQFAPEEELWRREHKLKPLYPFQEEADEVRRNFVPQGPIDPRGNNQSQIPVRQQPAQDNPYRMENRAAGMADSMRARSSDSMPSQQRSASAAQVEDQMKRATESKDQEATIALQTVKALMDKYGGVPPIGTRERDDFKFAMDMLKKKGIKLLPSTKQAKPKQLENPYGGDFYGF